MKKIFKYGCGCLGVIIGLIVLLLIITVSRDSAASENQKKISPNNSSGKLFEGVDSDQVSLLKWEKKGPQGFLQESAEQYVRNFLNQQGIIEGYDKSTDLICFCVNAEFSEREYRHIKLHGRTIELKAFMYWLSSLSHLLNEKIQSDKKENAEAVHSSSKLKWGDFDFSCTTTAVTEIKTSKAVHDSITKKLVLAKNGNNLITYTLDSKREIFSVKKFTVRGSSVYDELIRNFLKHHPEAVKLEYSAWSWNKKKMRGEFALALVLDFSKMKKRK